MLYDVWQVRVWYRVEYLQRTMEAHARWAFQQTPNCPPDFLAALRACEAPEEVHFFDISATEI